MPRLITTSLLLTALAVGSANALEVVAYSVQLSTAPTEDEALASFQALQRKYPAFLGRHTVVLHRVDLQNQSWYRAQVGPFATAERATRLCDNLKAAGGQCIVRRGEPVYYNILRQDLERLRR